MLGVLAMPIEIEQEFGDGTVTTTRLTFQEQAGIDVVDTFFESTEHATTHTVDGKEMLLIIDENELIDRSAHWEGGAKQSFDQGLYRGQRLFYVQASDFGSRPKVGKQIEVDKRLYNVLAVTEEDGVYAITIDRIRQ